MTHERDENSMASNGEGEPGAPPRVRFKGIVESQDSDGRSPASANLYPIDRQERRWTAMSRQVWQLSRLTAIFVFFAFIAGLPLGNYFAHLQINGTAAGWNIFAAYQAEILIFAFIVPMLVLLAGYLLSRQLTMLNAAESIAAAAQKFVSPDAAAIENADTVGEVVRGHVVALNEGIDGALSRLASVEAMIRAHVKAIEIAGEAIEAKATSASERVADERSRLMELTESLNAHADSFAAAIAERAKAGIEALESANDVSLRVEQDFDDRLSRLEDAAGRAFSSFESLREALLDTDETMRETADSIGEAAQQTLIATKQAKAASDEAAASAARNAANVAASAERATKSAQEAADKAIETARSEAERAAMKSIETATNETAKVGEATQKALSDLSEKTKHAVKSARDDAAEAQKAAADIAAAAEKAGLSAKKAAGDVAAASEAAKKASRDSVEISKKTASQAEERNKALAAARAALEEQNDRLEALIDEQRKRADRLAQAIASQTERLSRLAEAQLREQQAAARLAEAQAAQEAAAAKAPPERETQPREKPQSERRRAEPEPLELSNAAKGEDLSASRKREGAARLDELARNIAERRPADKGRTRKEPVIDLAKNTDDRAKRSKGDVSWREILDAADDAEPLELAAAERNPAAQSANGDEEAIKIIARLQRFTYDLETRLYGDPPPALQERFDRGDRNVFANRLLRLNESDVKRRIRMESARDRDFERGVHNFLQGFEKLLEDATTSEMADEELEEYLSSPLGRVYLLIGATVGYFA